MALFFFNNNFIYLFIFGSSYLGGCWYYIKELWFAVYSKKYVFDLVPISGTEFLKPLEFRECWDDFCYVVTEVVPWKHLRMGPGCQGNQLIVWRIGTVIPISWPPGREKGWRLGHWPMTNDLIKHAYVMKPPEKPKRMGFRELLGWWILGDLERGVYVEKAQKLQDLSPYLALCISFIWLFLNHIHI